MTKKKIVKSLPPKLHPHSNGVNFVWSRRMMEKLLQAFKASKENQNAPKSRMR